MRGETVNQSWHTPDMNGEGEAVAVLCRLEADLAGG
jgi:hypothetical protein